MQLCFVFTHVLVRFERASPTSSMERVHHVCQLPKHTLEWMTKAPFNAPYRSECSKLVPLLFLLLPESNGLLNCPKKLLRERLMALVRW